MNKAAICLYGAREHNLKNIHLEIPRDRFTVITGLSGSGKSTLAFDILFAEGQRRYIESLPAYVKQYLNILDRPDIDLLTGIPPTVAINQRTSNFTRRSTVATITEIYHYLRLLFSKIGIQYCPRCGGRIKALSKKEMLDSIISLYRGEEITILAPKVIRRKGFHKDILHRALKKGYKEARIDGKIFSIPDAPPLSRYKEHSIDLVIGRVNVSPRDFSKLDDTVSQALDAGNGLFYVLSPERGEKIYGKKRFCPNCQIGFPPLDPRLFSFNSPYGACPTCEGLGTIGENGTICPRCSGKRLNEIALSVRINGLNIWDMTSLSVDAAIPFLKGLRFNEREIQIARPIIKEILNRLEFLKRVGLPYLTLNRSGDTLSGGEAQRIRLATGLGSNLKGVCYILDEPTIGLHPRDNEMLISTLKALKEAGNSVIVVEHDEETIKAADFIIDLGPGPGREGGNVVAMGTLKDILEDETSITGKSLCKTHKITSRLRRARDGKLLKVICATAYNLKCIDVTIPLGTLVCVTGVSGSGKSSLVREVIYKGVKSLLRKRGKIENCKDILGVEHINRVLEVDHSPIGRTPRSTPGTYIGFWDEIRKLFSMLPESRARGYRPGRFSFNVRGGRCENCAGQGKIKVEMSFLPDVYINCEVCNGRRFNQETLDIKYKGKNISEVLDMTVDEAADFFSAVPNIYRPLMILKEMGLGYLRIGQGSNTLSGGEAQRIKLASELCKANQGKTLYILDEPTTGLHIADIKRLMGVLQRLVDLGNTIIIIEHNLEVIKEADFIIDLGPEGGEEGGYVVAMGDPYEIMKNEKSYTGRFLRRYIEQT